MELLRPRAWLKKQEGYCLADISGNLYEVKRVGSCDYKRCKGECCRRLKPSCEHLQPDGSCRLGNEKPRDCKLFPLTPWDVRNFDCSYTFEVKRIE